MVIGTGAEYSILAQITTLGFIYLAIKFIVWNKIFEYIGDLFKNKYTFAFLLIAIILAMIDTTLWEVYFEWLTFLIQSVKTAIEFIVLKILGLFGWSQSTNPSGFGFF